MASIDGVKLDAINLEISRVAEVKASEISGMMLDKSWFSDVLGTYLRYELTLKMPYRSSRQYNVLFELLTEPRPYHEFVLPYNDGEITLNARVEKISDVYTRMPGGKSYWKGLKVSVIANHPSKTLTLEESIAYGGAQPFPYDATEAEIGDLYEYTVDGWQATELDDADGKRY